MKLQDAAAIVVVVVVVQTFIPIMEAPCRIRLGSGAQFINEVTEDGFRAHASHRNLLHMLLTSK